MNGNTQPQRFHCLIERIGGYDGIPFAYFVRSREGWLTRNENFSMEIEKAFIFHSVDGARAVTLQLFPHATIVENWSAYA